MVPKASTISLRSRVGLNMVNFFLAEVVGVVLPFLNDYLKSQGWRYDSIGFATAAAGLGTLLFQTPAGFIVDKIRWRRFLLALTSVMLGFSYGVIPLISKNVALTNLSLFTSGAAQSFFGPLLGALALGLVGYEKLNKTFGANQCWNHLGNVAAALLAMAAVKALNVSAVFSLMAAVSILAALSLLVIKGEEINEARASGAESAGANKSSSLKELLKVSEIRTLLLCTALFHLANAPVMPLVALYIKHLHGSDNQVAQVVLAAQAVMVPVAFLTGFLIERFGIKPVFSFGFIVLPLRIFLYSLTSSPSVLVWIQCLDGIGAGIYGVAIVSLCARLTRGQGNFNGLSGLIATALALGGVIGPIASGLLVQHFGFNTAFYIFTGIAATAACVFSFKMPALSLKHSL